MKPYTHQDLEERGFLAHLLSGRSAGNAWVEINNILAAAADVRELTADKVAAALKKWGAKMDESSLGQRSALYRQFADIIYAEAQSSDDALFAQGEYLAEVLKLPAHLVKLAARGARQTAYFARCDKLLSGGESLPIESINQIFGYDYEDGLLIRQQVFQNHFNTFFDAVSARRRYSFEDEEALRAQCRALDIPCELKNNIVNALNMYRNLWNAENQPLRGIEVDFPLLEGELCYAATEAGLCRRKVVELEDNYFEVTRKFTLDETVTFKGEKLEHPKTKEEITAVLDIGNFFLTSKRLIYFSRKNLQETYLEDIADAECKLDLIVFRTRGGEELIYKFSDEAVEVMYILFKRARQAILP